ncbi:MAG TPA: hypothetical protein VEW47_09030 [Candidatus Dormibacteraeota bacterium]|nr:hypothetical protein [Candidatus Dormibacteraeota bacterium]
MSRFVRRLPLFVFALASLLTPLVPSGAAFALDRESCSMEILIDGAPLQEYAGRGTSYVEAVRGREYSVRLRNRTGERVAIALSVDGLNSIDARTTTASEARKWILEPYGTITLDGWQTSTSTARRFVFTTEDRSYGSWLGRTKNLGIVAAAVFRQKRSLPIPIQGEERRQDSGADSRRAPEPSAAPSTEQRKSLESLGYLAATGIGREVDHNVVQVAFDAEDAPSALLELRYEYRDTLVRLGVVPPDRPCDTPLSRRESARGFLEPGFAPDPYRQQRH